MLKCCCFRFDGAGLQGCLASAFDSTVQMADVLPYKGFRAYVGFSHFGLKVLGSRCLTVGL